MTIEEARTFLDNLKVCIEEHPIVADWLVEIADRKTENSSEIPNSCEDLQDWKDRMWAEAIVTEPTISKMEQVETMSCQECKHFNENAVMYLDQCEFCFKECHYEPKADTPQNERSE